MNWNTAPPQQGTIATNMAPGSNWQCVVTDMNGCTATQTIAVANAPSPTLPTFTVTRPTCFGVQDGAITIGYTSGTPDYQVTWSAPISVVQTSSATTQSVSNVGAGVYTATLTDSYGCTVINVVNVIQPSLVTLTTTATQTICYGTTAQISATGAGGTPGYTYTWSPSLGTTGGPYNVNPTVNSSYSVTIADVNGCSPLQKVINVVVTPSLSISPTASTVCDGNPAYLTPAITSPGNGGPYNFTWSNGTVNNAVPNSTLMVTGNYTAATVTNYTVTIDDGCTVPSASVVFTVNVNPLPANTFTATREGCAPLPVTLIGNSQANNIYTWSDNLHHDMSSSTNNTYSYVIPDSGKYTITLVVTDPVTGCVNTKTKVDYIEVYPQPVASFYATPPSASILEPTIYFTNTSQGAVSYEWNFGDPTSGSTLNNSILVNPSHYYDHTGEYYVHLFATSAKGCRAEASQIVEITPDFALYIPNTFTPDGNNVNDIFQPFGVGIDEEKYTMEIFDRWGESIFSSNSFRKGWDGSVKGGKQAPQGVYVYKMMVYDLQGGKHPYVGHVTVIRKDN
jgi:gliding motility-associated-like protein